MFMWKFRANASTKRHEPLSPEGPTVYQRTFTRHKTREVRVGNLVIGGDNPIIVQSMTTPDTYDVEATVSLGGASATVKFQWTVVDTNRPPVIKPPKNQKNFEHDSVWLEIQATDPDDDRLEYSATGLPPGLGIRSHSGVIEGHLPPNVSAGNYTVVVTVSDGRKSAMASFTWLVEPLPPPKKAKK